mgnify:CR=1 FL=1
MYNFDKKDNVFGMKFIEFDKKEELDRYSYNYKGEEYILEKSKFYDEYIEDYRENENSSKTIFNKDKTEELYSFSTVISIHSVYKDCYQDIYKLDDTILENLGLPTQREVLASSLVEYKGEEERIQENIDNYFNHFKEAFPEIIEKKNLQDKLPNFQIYTNNGIEFDSANPTSEISDELKKAIIEFEDEEYLNNMNLKNIEEWSILKDNGIVNIIYDSKDFLGRDSKEEYTTFERYCENTVKEELSKELVEKYEKGEDLKDFENELKQITLEKRGELPEKLDKSIEKKFEIEDKEKSSDEMEF